MSERRSNRKKSLVWAAALVLVILHQDFWLWNDRRLIFDFLPIGMAYHVVYSILAGLLWLAALRYAWPAHLEQWALGESENGQRREEEAP